MHSTNCPLISTQHFRLCPLHSRRVTHGKRDTVYLALVLGPVIGARKVRVVLAREGSSVKIWGQREDVDLVRLSSAGPHEGDDPGDCSVDSDSDDDAEASSELDEDAGADAGSDLADADANAAKERPSSLPPASGPSFLALPFSIIGRSLAAISIGASRHSQSTAPSVHLFQVTNKQQHLATLPCPQTGAHIRRRAADSVRVRAPTCTHVSECEHRRWRWDDCRATCAAPLIPTVDANSW